MKLRKLILCYIGNIQRLAAFRLDDDDDDYMQKKTTV